MLPLQHRLPSYDISRVMRSGKRVVGNGITIFIDSSRTVRDGNDKNSRFAFVVSTKVDKRAVVRNRMRRVLSESVGHLLPELRVPIDVVCIGSRNLIGLPQSEVENRIKKLL